MNSSYFLYKHNIFLPLCRYYNNLDIFWFDKELDKNLSFYRSLSNKRKCVLIEIGINIGFFEFLKLQDILNLLFKLNYSQAATEIMRHDWPKKFKGRAFDLGLMMAINKWFVAN